MFFSQAVPNSLSVQGTSSEFEVVPAEEQTSPRVSSGHPRSTVVSGWRVPAHPTSPLCFSHLVLAERPRISSHPWGTLESLGDTQGARVGGASRSHMQIPGG